VERFFRVAGSTEKHLGQIEAIVIVKGTAVIGEW
jgi:hypothetical protein